MGSSEGRRSETSEVKELGRLVKLDGYSSLLPRDVDWIRSAIEARHYWSLYFFSKAIVGHDLLDITPHLEISEFISNRTYRYKAVFTPRDTYKSTLVIDDELMEMCVDPTCRLLHIMASDENAVEASAFIDDQWRNNLLLRAVYPDRIPDFSSRGWSKLERTIARPSGIKGPTIRFAGINTKITGYHYTGINADDIIEQEAADSAAGMAKVNKVIANFEPLLSESDKHPGYLTYVGTRWSMGEHYGKIMGERKQYTDEKLFVAEGDPRFLVMKRAAVEDGPKGRTLFFPKGLGIEKLEEKKRFLESIGHEERFYCWYMNNPIAAEIREFLPPSRWQYIKETDTFVCTRRNGEQIPLAAGGLYRTVTVDIGIKESAKHDPSAVVMLGSDRDGWRLNLFSWRARVSKDDLVNKVIALHHFYAKRGQPIAVCGVEDVQAQIWLAEAIADKCARLRRKLNDQNYHVNLVPLKHHNKPKPDRIRGFIPYVADDVYFTSDRWIEINQEMAEFPRGSGVNLIDALAYQPQIWLEANPRSISPLDERARRFEVDKVRQRSSHREELWGGYASDADVY